MKLPLIILVLITAPFLKAQSYVVAQSNSEIQGNTTSEFPELWYVQTFTPNRDGMLSTISAVFYAPQANLPPYYTFRFHDTTFLKPNIQAIASVNAPTDVLSYSSSWTNLTADFSGLGISLEAGHRYAFSILTPAATTTAAPFVLAIENSSYSNGALFFAGNGETTETPYDAVFTVTAVPEPTISMLVALGGVLTCFKLGVARQSRRLTE